jgi:hypothetical protein
MFLKQLDQFMLQYYSFKAENIAKHGVHWMRVMRVHTLITYLLVHIPQKKKITLEIAAKIV